MVEEITNNLMKNFEAQLNIFENEIYKKINENFDIISKNINNQIDNYTQQIKIKMKKNNSNYLISLVLLSLANIPKLRTYFLKPENENKILSKSMQDPNGNYLIPSFLKFLKSSKNANSQNEIHEILKKIMINDYDSKNPGNIIKFIILQLHKELIMNDCMINEPEWNFSDKKALENLVNYFYVIRNKISDEFFCSIRIKKLNQHQTPLYLYHNIVVFDLFLDNMNSVEVFLENNFKALFLDKNDINKYCYNNEIFFSKEVKTISKFLIININRTKNKKTNIIYPINLDNTYLMGKKPNQSDIYELYSVIMSKEINNENYFYGYIQNLENKKWYLYNNKETKMVNNENEILDGENCLLLIYQKK